MAHRAQGPGWVVPCPCAARSSGYFETHLSPEQKTLSSEGHCAQSLSPMGSDPSRKPAWAQAWLLRPGPPPSPTALSKRMARVATKVDQVCRCDKDHNRGALLFLFFLIEVYS